MSPLTIDVEGDWLGVTSTVEQTTFGSLLIQVCGIPLTEVHDSLAQTTRRTIRVPAIRVAEWLIANYWRLRWEPRPRNRNPRWARAHSLAALGGGFAWPALEVAGDGEMVELAMQAETSADAAAIRYLRGCRIEVTGDEFDAALQRFLDRVENRIVTTLPAETSFRELREELRAERTDPDLTHWCRLEARAGINPGEATEEWRGKVAHVENEAGHVATEDMLAAAGVGEIATTVEAMKTSGTSVDLSAASQGTALVGKPWERGVAAAQAMRSALGHADGPMRNEILSEMLGVKLPLDASLQQSPPFVGGYRAPDLLGQTRVLVPRKRPTGQRFYLARLLGAASAMASEENVLPITEARTALQKVTRAFAQEFLCPWAELDAWTDANGTDEEAIAQVAEQYEVSEMLVATTLVNRGKLDRERLDAYAM